MSQRTIILWNIYVTTTNRQWTTQAEIIKNLQILIATVSKDLLIWKSKNTKNSKISNVVIFQDSD